MACGKRVEEEQEFERTIKESILMNTPVNYRGDIEGVIIPVHIVQDLPNLILEAHNEWKACEKHRIETKGGSCLFCRLEKEFKLKRDSHGKPK